MYLFLFGIDAIDHRQTNLHAHVAVKNVAQGKGDTGRLYLRSGHLIKQGLKLVMVHLIDEQYVKISFIQLTHKLDAGETAANHNHSGFLLQSHHFWF